MQKKTKKKQKNNNDDSKKQKNNNIGNKRFGRLRRLRRMWGLGGLGTLYLSTDWHFLSIESVTIRPSSYSAVGQNCEAILDGMADHLVCRYSVLRPLRSQL